MTTIYKVFDGAWFNAKYAIENDWKDKHVVLLFPEQVYPHTEEQQLSFPLLDMLKANMEYKEEDYVIRKRSWYAETQQHQGVYRKIYRRVLSCRSLLSPYTGSIPRTHH